MLAVITKRRSGFRYQIYRNGRAGTPVKIMPFEMCGTCHTNQAGKNPACNCANRYHCGRCAPRHRQMCVSAKGVEDVETK